MVSQTLYDIDKACLLFFNGSGSFFVDKLATTLTQGYWWIPFYITLLLMVVKNSSKFIQIALVIGCVSLCVVLSAGITDGVVKPLVGRLRPISDWALKGCVKKIDGYSAEGYSFFSAHAANTMSITMFFSLMIKNKMLASCMFVWVIINCWTRLYLGVHYPSDILVGLIWGVVCGIVSYTIYHKLYIKIETKYTGCNSLCGVTQYKPLDINAAICILILSFIIAIIYNLI